MTEKQIRWVYRMWTRLGRLTEQLERMHRRDLRGLDVYKPPAREGALGTRERLLKRSVQITKAERRLYQWTVDEILPDSVLRDSDAVLPMLRPLANTLELATVTESSAWDLIADEAAGVYVAWTRFHHEVRNLPADTG